jgi:hypothetical protein
MKSESKHRAISASRTRRSVLLVLPMCGLAGLFLTAQQLYPHLAAAYWQKQLAEAPAARSEIALDELAELGDVGLAALVEALDCDCEAVAQGAMRHLLDRLEKWNELSEKERSRRTLALVESLAKHAAAFGPTARRDACDLATHVIVLRPIGESTGDRSRLLAACDEILQTASSRPGESFLVSSARGKPNPETDARVAQSLASSEQRQRATVQFDPLPGGGLPLREVPADAPKIEHKLPGTDGEVPPGYFQEPAGTRSLDFSNHNAKPLRVSQIPRSPTQGAAMRRAESPIRAASNDASPPRETPSNDMGNRTTIDLMRRLAKSDDGQAEELQGELRRRGLSATEIGLARRLFDANPEARKQLVAELPCVPNIDASDWLLQCTKDEDAEVRLAAFSLLATSSNSLLLQKVKIAAANDADTRVRKIAEKIRDERMK